MNSATTFSQPVGDRQKFATGDGPFHARASKIVLAVFGLIALSLALPLASLGRWMFSRDYYQHWPLLVVGAIGLAFYRWRNVSVSIDTTVTIRVLFWLILGLVLTATVFVLPSRWMASLAAVATVVALTNYLGGRKLATLMLGPTLLLAAAVPLPVGFDNWFVVALQNLATWLASLWLDLAGIMHFTTGVSIQTATQDYYVKDACSGIHSVFAAVAVGAGYGVFRTYRVWRVLLFLAQLLFWVVVANALRVFLTVYGQSRWELDLSSDAYHEILGMVTFATGVLLAISGDHFLRYLNPAGTKDFDDWNAALEAVRESSWLDRQVSPHLVAGLVGSASVVGIVVAGLFFSYSNPVGTSMSIEEMAKLSYVDLANSEQGLLPATIGEWTQTAYRREEREETSIFGGMVSYVWQYTHTSGRRVLVSVDGPYDNWHDLAVCYRGTGWTVADMVTLERPVAGETAFACELNLARPPIDSAQVLYACIDPEGNDVKPPSYFGGAVMGLVRRFGIGTQDRPGFHGGVIQVQVYDDRLGDIDETQKKQNRELMWQAVEVVLSKGGGSGPR